MLTPREYAFLDAADSEAMGLPAQEHGLLFCEDEDAFHWTLAGDVDLVRMLRDALRESPQAPASIRGRHPQHGTSAAARARDDGGDFCRWENDALELRFGDEFSLSKEQVEDNSATSDP